MSAPSACFRSFDKKALELIEQWYFSKKQLNPFGWSIAESYRDIPRSCAGVYCAIADSKIIYVGESGNLRRRLRDHNLKPDFESYQAKFHYLPIDQRFFLERALILRHEPKLNRLSRKGE